MLIQRHKALSAKFQRKLSRAHAVASSPRLIYPNYHPENQEPALAEQLIVL